MINVRFIAAAGMFLAVSAHAQQMYVTDELVITLRSGPSTQNTVIANLRSGDPVEVLEQDADTGYTRVRAVDADEQGWVLTRYLMAEPASDAQLASATQELGSARQRIASLEGELARTAAELLDAQSALTAVQDSHRHVSSELDEIRTASANVLDLQEQNKSLRQRNLELATEVDALVVEANQLGSRSRQNWFVVGSLVLAFGIVIGLVAPSLRTRRRSNW